MRTTEDEELIFAKIERVKREMGRLPFEDRAGAYSTLADTLIDKMRSMTDGYPLTWIEEDLNALINDYKLDVHRR